MSGFVRRPVGILLWMLALPLSVSAQGGLGFGTMRLPSAVDSGCAIAASVLGGAAGMLVGGVAGALLERAVYSGNPEAGVTGLAVGMIAGAAIGIRIAPRACDERTETELPVRHRLAQPPRSALPSRGADLTVGRFREPRIRDVSRRSPRRVKMHTRRSFLEAGMWTAVGGLVAGCRTPGSAPASSERWDAPTLSNAAADERYWRQIRGAFELEDGLVNLNSGLSPAPRRVQRAALSEMVRVNRAPLYHMGDVPAEGREEDARHAAADALGCQPEELAITRSGTESLQMAQLGIELERGDEVLSTREDYWASWNMWQQRVAREGIVFEELDFGGPYPDPDDIVDRFAASMTNRTRVVSFSHVTWRTGHVLPVREICEVARERGIQTVVDGAQAFGLLPFRVSDLGCDYYATSGHKWLNASLGTGLLYVKRERIAALWPPPSSPVMASDGSGHPRGGDDIRKFELLGSRPPWTHNSVAEAVRFLQTIGVERKAERLHHLKVRWGERLAQNERVHLVTDLRKGRSCALASFYADGMPSDRIASRLLSEFGILVGPPSENSWSGPPLVRIVPNVFTSVEEIDACADAVEALLGG